METILLHDAASAQKRQNKFRSTEKGQKMPQVIFFKVEKSLGPPMPTECIMSLAHYDWLMYVFTPVAHFS